MYRSVKFPEAYAFEGDWPEDSCIIVVRTGTSREARQEAQDMAREKARTLGMTMINSGVFGWWRRTVRNRELSWCYDDTRGVPGWVFNVE